MKLKNRARSLAGFAAVLTLLGLIAADTVFPEVTLGVEDKVILISMISALLGVDLALNQLPINLQTGGGDDDD